MSTTPRRKRIAPAETVPVVHVLAQSHDLDTRYRLRRAPLAQDVIGRGAARAALGGEELKEDRSQLALVARAAGKE